jgi:hypothetical protein
VVSGGTRERARQHGDGALTGGPSSTVPVGSVLNRLKNIQTVQMKFEFIQIWQVQKIPSLASKI